MFVLQVCLQQDRAGQGGYAVWAERGPVERPHPRPVTSRTGIPPHPFAAAAEDLRDVLAATVGGAAGTWPDSLVTLRIPTAADGSPDASPQAASVASVATVATELAAPGRGDADRSGSPPSPFASFTVDAIALDTSAALDVLLTCDELPTGVVAGDGVRWLATVAAVALEHAAAGRVVPDLADEAGRACARWRALPDAGDDRLVSLGRSKPASLYAARPNAVPRVCAADLCDDFVDAAVRDALGDAPLRQGPRTSTAGRWLAALRGRDATVDVAPDAVASLSRVLRRWRDDADASAAGAARTCFRLTPPELGAEAAGAEAAGPGDDAAARGADRWTVELLLQARDDPSLLVPAAQVWNAAGSLRRLGRAFEHPQETLLAGLGRAVHLWPGLAAALAEATPETVVLEPAAVVEFLQDVVPLLEAAGFGVQVPAPVTGTDRVGLRLRATPRTEDASAGGTGLLGFGTVVAFEWEVAIGDHVLGEEELHRLAALKQPLVRHRGRWVQVDVAAVEAAVKFVESGRNRGEARAVDLLRTGLGLDPAEVDLPVQGLHGEGWVADLIHGGPDPSLLATPAPSGFRGELRGYQRRGLGWLRFLSAAGLGGCLADDMGLGKTVQVLALLAAEAGAGQTLLVCPTSVVTNWSREAARFTPELAVVVHHGPARAREGFADAIAGADLVVTTYGVVARDRELLGAVEWDRIVLDEAQLVKNSQAAQSRAVRSLRARCRLALTGTPVENRLSELWSIMEFCNPGLLGSAAGFRRSFAVPIERYRDDDAAALLGRLVRPFVLRRTKSDPQIALDLPDKIEETEHCGLTREQATLYQAVVAEMLHAVATADADGGGVRRRGLVLASMAKLKAICNHPAQLLGDGSPLPGRSGKLTRLEEVLETVLAAGERALVFTQFTEFGSRLRRHLVDVFGVDVPFLHGGVARAARDRIVAGFQEEEDGPPLLLVSLRAGGVGLNLTAANHVLHFDRWWNPAVEDQATDRAHRIGQRRDVFVHRFVCRGTVEERIDEMLEAKRGLADLVVGAGEDWLTGLSVADLRDVVALASDVVEEAD